MDLHNAIRSDCRLPSFRAASAWALHLTCPFPPNEFLLPATIGSRSTNQANQQQKEKTTPPGFADNSKTSWRPHRASSTRSPSRSAPRRPHRAQRPLRQGAPRRHRREADAPRRAGRCEEKKKGTGRGFSGERMRKNRYSRIR